MNLPMINRSKKYDFIYKVTSCLKSGWNSFVFALWTFTLASLTSNAQRYTYANESFEGTVWPTTQTGSNTTPIISTTGTWSIVKAAGSSAVTPATGSKYLVFNNGGGILQTPELTAGAGYLSFQTYSAGGSSRQVTVSTSTDGASFTDILVTPELSRTDWQLFTIPIKDVNVKYIKFANSGGGVVLDDVQVTSWSFTILPDNLSDLSYVVGTGPGTTKSFTITATNLTAGVPITITAPTNFEVSLDGVTWAKTVSIPNTAGGSLTAKTVYTRLVSGVLKGDYTGSIAVSGGGKTAPTYAVLSGSVTSTATPKCVSGEFLAPSRGEDFGTFTSEEGRGCASDFFVDPIFQCATGSISDYRYSILAQSNKAGGWAVDGLDHSNDPPGTFGGMLLINNGNTAGKVVFRKEWPVCTGANLELSAWYADGNAHAGGAYPNAPGITFNIYGGNSPGNITNLIRRQSERPPLMSSATTIWRQFRVAINTAGYTFIKLEITNDVNEVQGNDIIIDDIEFKASPLPVEVCITDAKCFGASDAQIEIKRVSGSANFTFVLDGSTKTGSSAIFTGLSTGTHSLKISDGSGACDVVPDVIINQPPKLVATATSVPACAAGGGSIGVLVSGGTPGYQYKEGSGSWGSSSVIAGLSNGPHTIDVRDANSCTTSASATVAITPPSNLTLASAAGTNAQTRCLGSTISDIRYSVNSAGATVTGLPTGLSSSFSAGVFTITGTPTQTGTFNYTVTSTGACPSEGKGTITINPIPTFSKTADTSLCAGNSIRLRVFNVSASNATIAWTKAESLAYTSSSATITRNNATVAMGGDYKIIVTASNCPSLEQTIKVTVNPTPASPTATAPAICMGTKATFTATGSATGTYYWYANNSGGSPLANPYTTPNNLTANTTHFLIDSVASSKCKSARVPVLAQVNALPNVTAPAPQTICAGQNVTLNGTGASTYVWQQVGSSNVVVNGTPFSPSSTGGTFTFIVTGTDANDCKDTASTKVFSTNPIVNNAVTSDQTICLGNNVNTLAQDASQPISGDLASSPYQWQSSATNLPANFANINGATSSSFTPNGLTATTYFRRIAKAAGVCPAETSNVVTITVYPAINPGAIGTSQSICSGAAINLTEVTAASGGNGTYSYTWKSSTIGTSSGFSDISGATSNTYGTSGITSTTYFVREVKSGSCTAQIGNPVTITVLPGLNPGKITGGTTICYNGNTSLTSTEPATGGAGPPHNYQWEQTADNGSTWTTIPSAITESLTISSLTQTTLFRRKVTSGTGTCSVAYSNQETVTVLPDFSSAGTIQLDKVKICSGEKVNVSNLSLPTGGTGTYTYSWIISDGTTTTTISGETGDNIVNYLLNTSTASTYTFTRIATSGTCGTKSSNQVSVEVTPLASYTVTLNPVADFCVSDPNPVNFSVNVAPSNIGTSGTYEWYVGGGIDGGSTSSTLSKSASSLSNGTKIKVVLKPSADVCPSQTQFVSNEISLVVASKIIPTISLASQSAVCAGTPVTLKATATGEGPTPSYTWLINGNAAPGATNTNTYSYSPISNDLVTVTVITSSSCISNVPGEDRATAQLTINVKPLLTPTVSIKANKTDICAGESVLFSVDTKTNTGNAPSFKWYVDNVPKPLENGQYFTSSFSNTSKVKVEMISNVECLNPGFPTVFSNTLDVNVTQNVTPKTSIFVSPSTTVCAGEPLTFSTANNTSDTANVGGSPKYEWTIIGRSGVQGTNPTFQTNDLKDGEIVNIRLVSSLKCLTQPDDKKSLQMKVITPKVSIEGLLQFCSDNVGGVLQVNDFGTGTASGVGPTYTWTTSPSGYTGTGVTIARSNLKNGDIVTVTMKSGYACTQAPTQDSKMVTIYTKPSIVLTAEASVICPDSSTKLEVTGGDNTSVYAWYLNNRAISNSNGSILQATNEGIYKVVVSNGPACASEATVPVAVQKMVVDAGPEKYIFKGESVILEGASNGSYSYAWTPNATLYNTTSLNPRATPLENTIYTITATSNLGCKTADFVLVKVFEPVSVPNAFSPNGDGLNDAWVIKGLEKYPLSHVYVFNRWGNKVFEDKSGYLSPWDGNHNGSELPTATYYYIVELKGSPDMTDRALTGALTIVK
jgi:gliding motility-associated-like protein